MKRYNKIEDIYAKFISSVNRTLLRDEEIIYPEQLVLPHKEDKLAKVLKNDFSYSYMSPMGKIITETTQENLYGVDDMSTRRGFVYSGLPDLIKPYSDKIQEINYDKTVVMERGGGTIYAPNVESVELQAKNYYTDDLPNFLVLGGKKNIIRPNIVAWKDKTMSFTCNKPSDFNKGIDILSVGDIKDLDANKFYILSFDISYNGEGDPNEYISSVSARLSYGQNTIDNNTQQLFGDRFGRECISNWCSTYGYHGFNSSSTSNLPSYQSTKDDDNNQLKSNFSHFIVNERVIVHKTNTGERENIGFIGNLKRFRYYIYFMIRDEFKLIPSEYKLFNINTFIKGLNGSYKPLVSPITVTIDKFKIEEVKWGEHTTPTPYILHNDEGGYEQSLIDAKTKLSEKVVRYDNPMQHHCKETTIHTPSVITELQLESPTKRIRRLCSEKSSAWGQKLKNHTIKIKIVYDNYVPQDIHSDKRNMGVLDRKPVIRFVGTDIDTEYPSNDVVNSLPRTKYSTNHPNTYSQDSNKILDYLIEKYHKNYDYYYDAYPTYEIDFSYNRNNLFPYEYTIKNLSVGTYRGLCFSPILVLDKKAQSEPLTVKSKSNFSAYIFDGVDESIENVYLNLPSVTSLNTSTIIRNDNHDKTIYLRCPNLKEIIASEPLVDGNVKNIILVRKRAVMKLLPRNVYSKNENNDYDAETIITPPYNHTENNTINKTLWDEIVRQAKIRRIGTKIKTITPTGDPDPSSATILTKDTDFDSIYSAYTSNVAVFDRIGDYALSELDRNISMRFYSESSRQVRQEDMYENIPRHGLSEEEYKKRLDTIAICDDYIQSKPSGIYIETELGDKAIGLHPRKSDYNGKEYLAPMSLIFSPNIRRIGVRCYSFPEDSPYIKDWETKGNYLAITNLETGGKWNHLLSNGMNIVFLSSSLVGEDEYTGSNDVIPIYKTSYGDRTSVLFSSTSLGSISSNREYRAIYSTIRRPFDETLTYPISDIEYNPKNATRLLGRNAKNYNTFPIEVLAMTKYIVYQYSNNPNTNQNKRRLVGSNPNPDNFSYSKIAQIIRDTIVRQIIEPELNRYKNLPNASQEIIGAVEDLRDNRIIVFGAFNTNNIREALYPMVGTEAEAMNIIGKVVGRYAMNDGRSFDKLKDLSTIQTDDVVFRETEQYRSVMDRYFHTEVREDMTLNREMMIFERDFRKYQSNHTRKKALEYFGNKNMNTYIMSPLANEENSSCICFDL